MSPLLALEQISIGGAENCSRLSRETRSSRDRGIISSLECRVPVFFNKAGAGIVSVAPFFDFGGGWNYTDSPQPTTIYSTGLGLLLAPNKYVNRATLLGIPAPSTFRCRPTKNAQESRPAFPGQLQTSFEFNKKQHTRKGTDHMTSNNHKTPGPARADSFKMWAGDEKVYGPVDGRYLAPVDSGTSASSPKTFVQCQSDSCWRRAEDVEILREKFTVTPLAAAAAPQRHNLKRLPHCASFRFFFAGLTNEGLEQVCRAGQNLRCRSGRARRPARGPVRDAVYFVLSPANCAFRLLVGVVDRVDKTLCKLGRGEFFRRTRDVPAKQADGRCHRGDPKPPVPHEHQRLSVVD